MAIISIDYDEGNQSSYRAVVLKAGSVTKRFETGYPDLDFPAAIMTARKELMTPILLSSSCDQFVHDGTRFGWRVDEFYGEIIYRLSDEEISALLRP
jgi:hypothetical protein